MVKTYVSVVRSRWRSLRNTALYMVIMSCGIMSFGLMSYVGQGSINKVSAEPIKKIKQARAFPQSAAELYQDDPWYELKLSAEQEMGLFLVEPPHRHASEVTQYSNDHLHFHLWRPVSESNQATWSRALGWLLFGRIKYSRGAQHLFAEIPSLKRITLSLHEVERAQGDKTLGCTSKRKGKKRARRSRKRSRVGAKTDKVQTYLTLSLTRENFEKLDVPQVKQCAQLLDCDRSVKQMVSLVKWNTRYLKSRR